MGGHQRYNINEASVDDLEQIPGVDHEEAEAIVEFRDRRGGIYSLDELMDIERIEPDEMDRLREWFTLASAKSGSLEYEGQREEPDIV